MCIYMSLQWCYKLEQTAQGIIYLLIYVLCDRKADEENGIWVRLGSSNCMTLNLLVLMCSARLAWMIAQVHVAVASIHECTHLLYSETCDTFDCFTCSKLDTWQECLHKVFCHMMFPQMAYCIYMHCKDYVLLKQCKSPACTRGG